MSNLGEILRNAINRKAKQPETIVLSEMPVPEGLKAIRETVINYYDNPVDYVDVESIRVSGTYGEFRIKELQEVLGVKFLGSGAYSNVFQVGDKALKIVKESDKAYASFVRFLRKEGYKYSCFPKVYYSGKWGVRDVYMIELLEEADDENYNERSFLASLAQDVFNTREGVTPKKNRFVNVPDDFYEGMKALRKYYEEFRRKEEFSIDLHSGNVIIRQNGTPVIIDPFA